MLRLPSSLYERYYLSEGYWLRLLLLYLSALTALLLLWDFRAPIEFKLEFIARHSTF